MSEQSELDEVVDPIPFFPRDLGETVVHVKSIVRRKGHKGVAWWVTVSVLSASNPAILVGKDYVFMRKVQPGTEKYVGEFVRDVTAAICGTQDGWRENLGTLQQMGENLATLNRTMTVESTQGNLMKDGTGHWTNYKFKVTR